MRARVQALREGLHAMHSRKDASGALLAGDGTFSGVLGALAALVTVEGGAEEAIAAALGHAADAVAVDGLDAAVAILEALRSAESGTAGLADRGPARVRGWRDGAGGCAGRPAAGHRAARRGPARPGPGQGPG